MTQPIIYVINLTRQPDRWDRMQSQANGLGLNLTRIDAIDRKTSSEISIRKQFSNSENSDVSLGDMCCTLSHYKAIHEFLASNREACIILEDDMTLSRAFADVVNLYSEQLLDLGLDCIKLEHIPVTSSIKSKPIGTFVDVLAYKTHLKIFHLRSSYLGAGAYMITRDLAQKLIQKYPLPKLPIDQLLFSRIHNKAFSDFKIGFIYPAVTRHEVHNVTSDIDKSRITKQNKTTYGKIKYEIGKTKEKLLCMRLLMSKQAQQIEMKFIND